VTAAPAPPSTTTGIHAAVPGAPPSPSNPPDTGTHARLAGSEACPLCGMPLHPEQDWCLRCGAAARTRLAATPNWKAPIATVAVIAALALGVLAAALVKLAGGSEASPSSVTSTVTTVATTAAPTAAAPVTPTSTVPGASTPGALTPGAVATATTPTTPTTPATTSAAPTVTTTPTSAGGASTTSPKTVKVKSRTPLTPAEREQLRRLGINVPSK
jgi:hypothetical protein